MRLEILKYPHPMLQEVAVEVKKDDINDEMRAIFQEMRDLMDGPGGVGLAAIQVGIKKRFFIMVDNMEDDFPDLIVAINPIIIESSGTITDKEGCLSFPDVSANVKRFVTVKMRALNQFGEEFELEREGYLSRCIQHEIDHLNGITYFDHLGPIKRKMIEKRYKRLLLENAE